MPSDNRVISRLQNQRSRIQGMLTPGKRSHQPGTSMHASLSPVAPDFAGRKFQLAARKMRILDSSKLGQVLSGGLTSLSTEIQSRFAEIQKIIHINPAASRQESIWSSVETPLPEGPVERQDTPLEHNTLRAGSIIQKMSTTPQPGQSLDSFKEQVQKQPRLARSQSDKKPVIDRNTRRFSRVQEVTPGQKLPPPDLLAVPVKPDETQPPVPQAGETPGPATIQLQPDPSAKISRIETPQPGPARIFQSPDLPAKTGDKGSVPEMPLRAKPRPTSRSQQQTPPDEIAPRLPETRAEQPLPAQKPVEEQAILKALPVVKTPSVQSELKKALPVKKEPKETPKPVARPTLKAGTEAPSAPVRPLIQRQPEAGIQPPAPVRPVIQPPTETRSPRSAPVRSDMKQSAQKEPSINLPASPISPVNLPVPPARSEVDAGMPAMPLKQNIDYRQNAPRAIKKIASESIKPVSQPPLIQRLDTPLITRSVPRQKPSAQVTPPALQAREFLAPTPRQDQPSSPVTAPGHLPMDMPQRKTVSQAPIPQNLAPIPMPLAIPAAAPAPANLAQTPQPSTTPVQPRVGQVAQPSPALRPSGSTIQREWEGHTPPSQSSSGGSKDSNKSSASSQLESLAEDVFPYVKRILEIEADRSSGKLS